MDKLITNRLMKQKFLQKTTLELNFHRELKDILVPRFMLENERRRCRMFVDVNLVHRKRPSFSNDELVATDDQNRWSREAHLEQLKSWRFAIEMFQGYFVPQENNCQSLGKVHRFFIEDNLGNPIRTRIPSLVTFGTAKKRLRTHKFSGDGCCLQEMLSTQLVLKEDYALTARDSGYFRVCSVWCQCLNRR